MNKEKDGLLRRQEDYSITTAGYRGLVKHELAEQALLLLLAGFASSVIVTRTFLEWTGYPQMASGDFHIAHVLWGGLLLFLAALLLLVWRGRRAYWLGSLLAGIGFGLFIDEVGKFITTSNDYFYPLAAPLIYASFLITVLGYLHVRRLRADPAGAEVYGILYSLERGIDPHSTYGEYEAALEQLKQAAAPSDHPHVARLAKDAGRFLQLQGFQGASGRAGFVSWWQARLQAIERWFTPRHWKFVLTAGFLVLGIRGIFATVAVALLLPYALNPAGWQQLINTPMALDEVLGTPRLVLVVVGILLDSLTGLLLLAAAILLIAGRTRNGLQFGYWGLVISLTAVQLFMFYINQFDAVTTTLLQFILLFGVVRYRSNYLSRAASQASTNARFSGTRSR